MNGEKQFRRFVSYPWKPNFSLHPQVDTDSWLECVIIEPRAHRYLHGVLNNFSHMFPNANLTIVHSKANENAIMDILKDHPNHNIHLLPICNRNLSISQYNQLLTSTCFWSDVIKAKHALVFQTDTGIRYNGILKYLQYDYVGAPWPWVHDPNQPYVVGNGGLSLRKRDVMNKICNKYSPNGIDNVAEDIFFSKIMFEDHRESLPSLEIASGFSVEHVANHNPMGFHQVYRHKSEDYVYNILNPSHIDIIPSDELVMIQDAWIETHNGRVLPMPYDLRKWLSVGVSAWGLRVPADTKLPNCPTEMEGNVTKLKIKHNMGESETILLGNQVQQGIFVHSKNNGYII